MSDFANTTAGSVAPPAPPTPPDRSLARLKQDYLSYLDGKRAEIDEQQEARRSTMARTGRRSRSRR